MTTATIEARDELALEIHGMLRHLAETGEGSPSERQPLEEWYSVLSKFGFFHATVARAVLNGHARELVFIDYADVRPREPVRLFRVASPGRERRLSWTPMLERSLRYAPGGPSEWAVKHPDAHLWTALVPAERVLCIIDGFEWILDTRDMQITDLGAVSMTFPTIRLDSANDTPARAALIEQFGADYQVTMLTADPLRIDRHDPSSGALS